MTTAATTLRKPKRLQRSRAKGWSKPRGAVIVTRGTRWGNGWKIGDPHPDEDRHGAPMTRKDVVDLYARSLMQAKPSTRAIIRRELRGKDLICWCRPDQECHADLLLAVANGDPEDFGDPI